MNSGLFNRIIQVQSATFTTHTTDGEPVLAYSTILNDWWAQVEPVTGNERYIMQERLANIDVVFRIRYTSAINYRSRIIYESATYEISAIIDPMESHKTLKIFATKLNQ